MFVIQKLILCLQGKNECVESKTVNEERNQNKVNVKIHKKLVIKQTPFKKGGNYNRIKN